MHNIEKYTKHFYSSKRGFNFIKNKISYQNLNADNMLVLKVNNKFIFQEINKNNFHAGISKKNIVNSSFLYNSVKVKLNNSFYQKNNFLVKQFVIESNIDCFGYDASFPYQTNKEIWQTFLKPKKSSKRNI